jgi:hypothetical protein
MKRKKHKSAPKAHAITLSPGDNLTINVSIGPSQQEFANAIMAALKAISKQGTYPRHLVKPA